MKPGQLQFLTAAFGLWGFVATALLVHISATPSLAMRMGDYGVKDVVSHVKSESIATILRFGNKLNNDMLGVAEYSAHAKQLLSIARDSLGFQILSDARGAKELAIGLKDGFVNTVGLLDQSFRGEFAESSSVMLTSAWHSERQNQVLAIMPATVIDARGIAKTNDGQDSVLARVLGEVQVLFEGR